MSKPKTELSIRDKHLIRLAQWNYMEYRQAIRFVMLGDVEIYTLEMSFDDGGFEYPFGDVGTHKLFGIRFTDQGRARIDNIIETDLKAYESFLSVCCARPRPFGSNQILFTYQGAIEMINFGKRDQLFVFNKITVNEHDFDFEDNFEDDSNSCAASYGGRPAWKPATSNPTWQN